MKSNPKAREILAHIKSRTPRADKRAQWWWALVEFLGLPEGSGFDDVVACTTPVWAAPGEPLGEASR